MEEEIGDEVDTIVGISINGIAFAQAIGGQMDLDIAISRSISDDGGGHISEVFADVEGKKCVVVDDVLSGGTTMSKTVSNLRAAGQMSSFAWFWPINPIGMKSKESH